MQVSLGRSIIFFISLLCQLAIPLSLGCIDLHQRRSSNFGVNAVGTFLIQFLLFLSRNRAIFASPNPPSMRKLLCSSQHPFLNKSIALYAQTIFLFLVSGRVVDLLSLCFMNKIISLLHPIKWLIQKNTSAVTFQLQIQMGYLGSYQNKFLKNRYFRIIQTLTMENHSKKTSKQPSKLNLQSISIFNYYLKSYFPSLFQMNNYPPSQFVKLRATQRNLTYNYVYEICSGIEDVTYNTILQASRQVYSSMQGVNGGQNGFTKKTVVKLPYLPIWREITQKIDIVITKQSQKSKEGKGKNFCSPHKIIKSNTNHTIQRKKSHPLISMKNIQQNSAPQIYQLYILHHSNHTNTHSTFQWENFVERYRFDTQMIDGEKRPKIKYESVFVYNSELRLDQSHKLLQLFYQNSLFIDKNPNKLPIVQKLCGKLRNLVQIERSKIKVKLQSVNYDQIHRRELKLTRQQKVIFDNLKVKTFAYFSSINRQRQVNRYFLQNLICRMMGNQNYDQNESWQSIKYYLQFQKKMRGQYKWRDFQKYDKMNIFSYIGKDTMGRPVVMNRIRNILCSKIQNFDQFYYYHLYLFQIYMQDQMEGWVDQFVVIADASNQISDNTNIGFTKRLLMESLKVTLGRIYKIIAFDVGFIGIALYRLLNPLLPSSFTDRVKLFGDDKSSVLQELRFFISDQVIPKFIGGNNITIDSKGFNKQQRLNTERTNESSTMLRNVRSLKAL